MNQTQMWNPVCHATHLENLTPAPLKHTTYISPHMGTKYNALATFQTQLGRKVMNLKEVVTAFKLMSEAYPTKFVRRDGNTWKVCETQHSASH